MPNSFQHLLPLEVEQLLDHPDFRAWAADPTTIDWPADFPAAEANFRTARAILLGIDLAVETEVPSGEARDADFAALLERIEEEKPQQASVRKLANTSRRRFLSIAATVALLVTVGFFALRPSPTLEYATGNSERLEFRLEDGTQVVLNANSRLLLTGNNWGGAPERIVNLTGEAWFEVAKQQIDGQNRPFLVRTTGAEIRVLGTRFNVRNRRGGDKIYLEEGSVRVNWTRADFPEVELRPGELVERTQADAQPVHLPVNKPAKEVAWREGHLLFERLPLGEALAEVSDIYGIELQCPDQVLFTKEITSAGIPVDDLPLALRLLETAFGLRIEARENSSTYTVHAAE